jgi:thiamine-phosphate pyrophosphorylase
MATRHAGQTRRERLSSARLYLVAGAAPGGGPLGEVLEGAIAGGVDVFQLREKDLPDEQLLDAAAVAREACERAGALFIVNDRPELALAAGADGVHVGQDDMPVGEVRALVGCDALVGLSTHARDEIDAADPGVVDYIGVGPVFETPTKPGRAAVGFDLVRYAAARARVPFFAIGGLDAGNLDQAIAAGARRVCVLRAVGEATDPQAAARALATRLDAADGWR